MAQILTTLMMFFVSLSFGQTPSAEKTLLKAKSFRLQNEQMIGEMRELWNSASEGEKRLNQISQAAQLAVALPTATVASMGLLNAFHRILTFQYSTSAPIQAIAQYTVFSAAAATMTGGGLFLLHQGDQKLKEFESLNRKRQRVGVGEVFEDPPQVSDFHDLNLRKSPNASDIFRKLTEQEQAEYVKKLIQVLDAIPQFQKESLTTLQVGIDKMLDLNEPSQLTYLARILYFGQDQIRFIKATQLAVDLRYILMKSLTSVSGEFERELEATQKLL